MNRLALLPFATALFALTGCATFAPNELASLRGRGVPPRVVEKLDRGQPLAPADVIELRRQRVPDPWVLRQLEAHDVDSLITRSDVTAMRRAGVTPAIIDATLKASDRFQDRYRYPAYGDPYDSMWAFGDPFGFYDPLAYPGYPGFGVSFIAPLHGHSRHHRR